MARKSGLGKGLDALIPIEHSTDQPVASPGALFIPVQDIIPNPRQPRHTMNENKLQELSDSIREHGVIQPLIVTHEKSTNQYILIAGERRLRASRLAGLTEVPVLVREVSAQESLEMH